MSRQSLECRFRRAATVYARSGETGTASGRRSQIIHFHKRFTFRPYPVKKSRNEGEHAAHYRTDKVL